MPKTRVQKIDAVIKLKEKLERAKALVFADYKGLNMSQLSTLRDQLTEQNAQFIITKNSILKRALPEVEMEGPTATLFAYDDQITPIKILVKALKDAAIGSVKSGFLDGEALDSATIIQLSTLPSRNELREKVVGVLVSPLSGIVTVLNANLRGLVYALDQIKKSKGGV